MQSNLKLKYKHIIFSIVLAIFIGAMSIVSQARILSSNCIACHGQYPGMMEELALVRGKYKYLFDNTVCVGCHSSSDSYPIKILGGVKVPIVFNRVKPERMLAGGNFYFLQESDRKGHNVHNIAEMDRTFKNIPPGYDNTTDNSTIGFNFQKPLTCSGANGCHGDRNIENPFEAIRGSHHAKDSPLDGTTVAKSYRFLKGIKGYEDPDWNLNASPKEHNEYSADIDKICINCHGKFHRKENLRERSRWLRHPTGVPLPKRGEYMNYTKYDPSVPVGRTKIAFTSREEVVPGEDTVICLSCHYAHAGPYDSLLRWDYDNIFAHEGQEKKGCLVCHTRKQH